MTNPTYNFYNCCCPTTNLDCDENNTNYAGSIFPIKTTGGGLWANWRDGDVDSANRFIPVNFPLGLTTIYNNMEAFHFSYVVKELSLRKTRVTGTTNESIEFTMMVMDMDGNYLRTLSTNTLDLVSLPIETWVSVPLVAAQVDLTIQPNEILIQEFKINTVNTDDWRCNLFVSGLAEMV
jgi:hypothetical protein